MGKSVNRVILLGNVGKDPELRSTQGGTTVANFSIATSDSTKDAQGNWTEQTTWHNCVAFKRTAEIVRDYVKKGSKVYVEGKLQTSSWEDKTSGQKRYKTEIIVNELVLLSEQRSERTSAPASQAEPELSADDIDDSEIPF